MKKMIFAEILKQTRTEFILHSFRLLLFVFCLGMVTTAPAFGGSSYSSSWVNTSGSGSIWGCGVTEQSYTSGGHSSGVGTTISSPAGRTASYGTGHYLCPSRCVIAILIE